ncbi:disease resistance protein RGA5-like [Triticum dicoccoides]|uniref:disease resistance protein RGA5-like n=1 Tax=Triticum dicoccoides TaxID=85692 RepID=UPI000E7CF26B|nr:disease resistance protein RGA5-like [Triticum dicoccoides]XP_037481797.1 disease resistance protein RGA5-like [Triticum dicoccoides]
MAPVVTAALGALGPLLGKLAELLANECGRLRRVRREIRSLRTEFTSMHGALMKYTKLENENPDDQVKIWVSLVRELAYDTEDLFDKFIRHLGNGESHDGGFKEYFRKTARCLKTLGAWRGIASRIDDLKLRIKEVKELKTSYKLDDVASSTPVHATVDPRLAALFAEEAHLVGIDSPRDELAKWMLEEENKLHRRVLSIVGFGGLGKTTLANEVYRKIHGRFDCHAFVSVSQKPDRKKIIKDLISQVSCNAEFTKDMDTWDEQKSISKLRELLQDKRYLVIIDDIWSALAWKAINCAFPENDSSSRIITTTRILEVARSCCPDRADRIYEMTPLSDIHSERLFFNRIFGPDDRCPDMLIEVSNTILKKCGSLPLAIISITGLLANRPRVKEEWEKVKRSIGSELDGNQSLEGMKNILSMSYNDLPPNLKTVLLHLSNFPEDYVIDRERLVRQWIAEGFISEERGRSFQEVAESYFYELINKSLVQPVDIRYDGMVRACRVHDMMLELIISKSIEENFITVVNGSQTVWENSQCSIRRLSIQDIDQELASVLAKKELSHVRSLIITASRCIKHLPSLAKFETLRVLDFEGCRGLTEYDMDVIENLFQLKYLSFCGTNISELPSGIMMLHDLEMLDLRGTAIKDLPARIVQLTKLQHLLPGNHLWKIPIGIGNMTNLREISGFDITTSSVGAVKELGSLINLKVLHVCFTEKGEESHEYKSHLEMFHSSLCKLGSHKLQSVYINGGDSSPFELLDSWSPLPSCLQTFVMGTTEYCLSKLPKWITPALTSLAYLNINLGVITEEALGILGELPALLSLKLYTNTVHKDRLVLQGRGFRCLKEFVYEPFDEGAGILLFEEGALPKLEEFMVRFFVSMAKAYGFYLGIEHLPYLKDVHVILQNRDATSSEAEAAEVAIRKEANLHPNHPRLTLLEMEE